MNQNANITDGRVVEPATEVGHYINNERVASTSGRNQPVYNPATGEATKTVALASVEEVNTAVAAAKTAWATWSKTPPAAPRPDTGPVQDDPVGSRRSAGRGHLA